MDSSFISLIVIVAIAVLAPWFEAFMKKLGRVAGKLQNGAPQQSVRRAPQPLKQSDFAPRTRTEAAKIIAKAPKAPIETALPEEGVRVTADIKPKVHIESGNKPKLEPLKGDELRKALIWGEILKPKF